MTAAAAAFAEINCDIMRVLPLLLHGMLSPCLLTLPRAAVGGGALRVAPNSPLLQYSGRFQQVETAAAEGGSDTVLQFDHPGTELRLRVRGAASVSLELLQERSPPTKIGHNTYPAFQPQYFVVTVDGSVQPGFANATFSTAACQNISATLISAASGLDPSTTHDVRIFKSSEAQWAASVPAPNWLTLTSVVLGADATAEGAPAGPPPQLLALPAWRPDRRLEFIGDSLMAGYCNLLWSPDIHRHKTNRSNIESFWLAW